MEMVSSFPLNEFVGVVNRKPAGALVSFDSACGFDERTRSSFMSPASRYGAVFVGRKTVTRKLEMAADSAARRFWLVASVPAFKCVVNTCNGAGKPGTAISASNKSRVNGPL